MVWLPSRGRCSEEDRTHTKGEVGMGKREQGESCPALSPILREVNLVLVLLLFLNLIFLYFDLIFLYFVLSYFCILVFLYVCIFVLCTFCTFVFYTLYLLGWVEGGDRKGSGRWTSCCFISHFDIPSTIFQKHELKTRIAPLSPAFEGSLNTNLMECESKKSRL